METHPDIKRLAKPFWAGALSENADRAVQEHAENCEVCAGRLLAARPSSRSFEPARRMIKILVSSAALISLVLLGAFFQDGFHLGANAAPSPAEFALCLSSEGSAKPMPDHRPGFNGLAQVRPGGSLIQGGGPGASPQPARDPFSEDARLIRHAELQLQVATFEAALTRADEIASADRGFISGVDMRNLENGSMSGSLTVRVPSERFDPVLARLRSLGVVLHQNLKTRDVTKTYLDLEARLSAKQTMLERLKKILLETPGAVKELLEVEVQIGRTVEEIEALKGELQFQNNQIAFATIVLWISEKTVARPIEVVETIEAEFRLAVREPESAYVQAQKILLEAGGQLNDTRLSHEDGGSALGRILGRIDAAEYPGVRASIRGLGHVLKDAVKRQRLTQGGTAGAEVAPLKSEQATVEIIFSTMTAVVTRQTELRLEVPAVDPAYPAARRIFEEAGAVLTGGTMRIAATNASATLYAEVDADRAADLSARLATIGTQKSSETRYTQPTGAGTQVLERVRFEVHLSKPVETPVEASLLARAAEATWAGSVTGLFWSIERLFVGLALASPWAGLALASWFSFRCLRRRKPAAEPVTVG